MLESNPPWIGTVQFGHLHFRVLVFKLNIRARPSFRTPFIHHIFKLCMINHHSQSYIKPYYKFWGNNIRLNTTLQNKNKISQRYTFCSTPKYLQLELCLLWNTLSLKQQLTVYKIFPFMRSDLTYW